MVKFFLPQVQCSPVRGVAILAQMVNFHSKKQNLLTLDESLSDKSDNKFWQEVLSVLADFLIALDRLVPDNNQLEMEIQHLSDQLKNKSLLDCVLNAEILMQRQNNSLLNSERLEIVVENVVEDRGCKIY
jgi:hypothetical protein